MAKRKPIAKKPDDGTVVLSSGVTIKLIPFPPGLRDLVLKKAIQDFPDPEVPEEGTESADYQSALEEVGRQRASRVGEALLDFSVEVDLEPWRVAIENLERLTGPFPEDPNERKLAFLTGYALQTAGDWEKVMVGVSRRTTERDPETVKELRHFQTEGIFDAS